MKFYKIAMILGFRENKFNRLSFNRKTFNKLYKARNIKKESNKMDSESDLYTFTPLINQSGYITLSPINGMMDPSNISRYGYFKKNNPFIRKYSTESDFYPMERNILSDRNFYDYKNPNGNITENDNYYNDNNILHGYPNDYLYNSRAKRSGIFNKKLLNTNGYGFYTPKYNNRKRNLYSNRDDQINNQISKYLNDFNDNNRKLNLFNKNNNLINKNNDYPKRTNKSFSKIGKGNNYDISRLINKYETPFKTEFQTPKVENYFNKSHRKNDNNSNSKISNDRLSFRNIKKNKGKNIFSLKSDNKNKSGKNEEENKKIYNDSKKYFYSFNKKNNDNNDNNNINNNSIKNSNKSLIPSSVGGEHMMTFYTNKPLGTNNNVKTGNGVSSNINSASPRMNDTNYHFLNGLKMTSGEINEYFFDFNSNRIGKDKSEDQKTEQSLQSLSDSKMLELANYYINDESNSVENYQMNNVVFNKRRHQFK